MGSFLDKPRTEKTSIDGDGNGLKFATSSIQGWRVEMEDAHTILVSFDENSVFRFWSFFAVFDGHAGSNISQYSSVHLPKYILENEKIVQIREQLTKVLEEDLGHSKIEECTELSDNVKTKWSELLEESENQKLITEGLQESFLKIDEFMRTLEDIQSGVDRSGTTAVTALLSPSHIYIANCGDSRGILVDKEKNAYIVTKDHKPTLREEKDRITKAGGSVMIQRVNGSLAVSRALGDYDYKRSENLPATAQLVSPEPDIYQTKRSEGQPTFLLLACDGVWDVINPKDISEFISHMLETTSDLKKICEAIIDSSLHMGSRDNISASLIVFPGAPSVDPDLEQADAEIEAFLKNKVKEIVESVNDNMDVDGLMRTLSNSWEDYPDRPSGLPPHVGIGYKRGLVESTFRMLRPHDEDEQSDSEMPTGSRASTLAQLAAIARGGGVPSVDGESDAATGMDNYVRQLIHAVGGSNFQADDDEDEEMMDEDEDIADDEEGAANAAGDIKLGVKYDEQLLKLDAEADAIMENDNEIITEHSETHAIISDDQVQIKSSDNISISKKDVVKPVQADAAAGEACDSEMNTSE